MLCMPGLTCTKYCMYSLDPTLSCQQISLQSMLILTCYDDGLSSKCGKLILVEHSKTKKEENSVFHLFRDESNLCWEILGLFIISFHTGKNDGALRSVSHTDSKVIQFLWWLILLSISGGRHKLPFILLFMAVFYGSCLLDIYLQIRWTVLDVIFHYKKLKNFYKLFLKNIQNE